jgi:hypothetical protein
MDKSQFCGGRTIRTAYIGPSNTRGGRISAKGNWHGRDGRREYAIFPYDAGLESSENHFSAALELSRKLGWGFEEKKIGCVESEDGRGYVFFFMGE